MGHHARKSLEERQLPSKSRVPWSIQQTPDTVMGCLIAAGGDTRDFFALKSSLTGRGVGFHDLRRGFGRKVVALVGCWVSKTLVWYYMFVTSWTVCVGANQPQGFGKPSFFIFKLLDFPFWKQWRLHNIFPDLCPAAVSYYWLTLLHLFCNTRGWSTWIKAHPSVHTQTVDSHVCQSSLSSLIS